MCLIAFAYRHHPGYRLVVAANRDEFFARPAAALGWWDDGRVLAGRDLYAGGAWLGCGRDGRFAALTNYRDLRQQRNAARSRGELSAAFLGSELSAADYLAAVRSQRSEYNDFNLLLFDGEQLLCLESRYDSVQRIAPGVHALSNHRLNTPWPKVRRLRAALEQSCSADDLSAALSDAEPAADDELPDTGVGLAWERLLSPPFVRSEHYGTRAQTLLWLGEDGSACMQEQSFAADGPLAPMTRQRWRWRD